ncbi:unnamed protein product, partial [Nesidiocoris tenuis]
MICGVMVNDIVKFEKRKQKRYANYPSMVINVYETGKKITSTDTERSLNGKTTEKDDIRPVLISTFHYSAEKEIDLLYITDDNSGIPDSGKLRFGSWKENVSSSRPLKSVSHGAYGAGAGMGGTDVVRVVGRSNGAGR